jgi:hypothetical protein
MIKAALLDRSEASEVGDFNKLMNEYNVLVAHKPPRTEETKELTDELDNLRAANFMGKPLKFKKGQVVDGNINSDIKDFTKSVKNARRDT